MTRMVTTSVISYQLSVISLKDIKGLGVLGAFGF